MFINHYTEDVCYINFDISHHCPLAVYLCAYSCNIANKGKYFPSYFVKSTMFTYVFV